MDKIEELIRYNQENVFLDFKSEEYKDHNKANLLKDVLAMANADYKDDRFIIIGVKKTSEETTFFDIAHPTDSASVQQYIHANISPEIQVSYESYLFEGKKLVVLAISNTNDRPYFATKDVQTREKIVLRKNEMLIRKGTYQMAISRTDLDRIYTQKLSKLGLDNLITFSFDNSQMYLRISCIRDLLLPSDSEKNQIEEEIKWKEELILIDPKKYSERFGRHRGIQNSYSEMDLVVLRSQLSSVKKLFEKADEHYLYEERAYKLNFEIHNIGDTYLEKGFLEVRFPKMEGFNIISRPIIWGAVAIAASITQPITDYPEVTVDQDFHVVKYNLGEIRHRQPHQAFKKALRIFANEQLTDKKMLITAKIFAANLIEPQLYQLEIQFVD